jgi:hypothetical protein
MNRQEFESAIKNTIVTPITSVITSANFQDEYTPEDMIKYLDKANNTLIIRKVPAGLQTSRYWTFTHNEGYISCTISDAKKEPGGLMNPVEEYFKSHATQLSLFKHGVKILVPSALAFLIWAISTHATEWQYAALILIGLNWAKEKIDKLDADEVWQGVGAKKKK